METLEEWLKSNAGTLPNIVQKWSNKLVELGASWDTFSEVNEETLDDLVDGGIPRLSARDICRVMSEVVQRRSRPSIILWDIENVQIPTETSAALVVSQIKAAVQPYGQVKQFRAYASVSLGHIPEEKRSELHLSGCNLVDSPHLGRKEVADEMIIVDAMEFAYTHLDGATLCFITGDVDYAYLLSKLQKPQWTTIVISKGSDETMLHANCNVNLSWETDILRLPPQQPGNKVNDQPTSAAGLTRSAVVRESAITKPFATVLEKENIANGTTNNISPKQMEVSKDAPLTPSEMPPKALELAKSLKFIIFIKKRHVAKGSNITGVLVQRTDTHLLLMFKSLEEAQNFAAKHPGLVTHGTLVNWQSVARKETTKCALCNVLALVDNLYDAGQSGHVCRSCFGRSGVWTETEKRSAQERVASLLKMAADYDDMFVPVNMVQRQLVEKYSTCASKGQAGLWISSAIEAGCVVETKLCEKRTKVLVLPENKVFCELKYPSGVDTSEEERYVSDLLWANNRVMNRKEINNQLKEKFPQSMALSSRMRSLVFRNGLQKKSFHVAKSADGQMVGLIHEDATTALGKLSETNELKPHPGLSIPSNLTEEDAKPRANSMQRDIEATGDPTGNLEESIDDSETNLLADDEGLFKRSTEEPF